MKLRTLDQFIDEEMKDDLQVNSVAAEYMNECLRLALTEDKLGIFLSAIMDVMRANPNTSCTQIAATAGATRASIYKSLSNNGNPQLETIVKILYSMGFEIRVMPTATRHTKVTKTRTARLKT